MSIYRRFLGISTGLLLLAGARALSVANPVTFAPYTPQALPQRAQGDFDGDGQPDVALIQNSTDGSRVSVTLSGSSKVVYLEGDIRSLIADDIDGDGDLDLVAAAPSGPVMAWLNDGQGRFTLQKASHSNSVSGDTVLINTLGDQPVALCATAPLVAPCPSNLTEELITLVGTLPARAERDLRVLVPASLRAPPLSACLG